MESSPPIFDMHLSLHLSCLGSHIPTTHTISLNILFSAPRATFAKYVVHASFQTTMFQSYDPCDPVPFSHS